VTSINRNTLKLKIFFFLFLLANSFIAYGQELFPSTEPASTMPKGVVGARFLYESYKELPSNRTRYWGGLRLMYGATAKLTVMMTGTGSNHHLRKFPADLRNYFISHHSIVYKPNPFLIEGVNLYAKYRWFSKDEQNKHLRLAFYAEAGKAFVPHDEAEPVLGDNTGIGGGIIGTKLHNRFAISLTCGYTHPFTYVDKAQQITFKSGNSWNYNLSLGYRVAPIRYSSYKNLNVNVYIEFINKSYDAAKMTVKGHNFDFDIFQNYDPLIYKSLIENRYSEIRPSIQFIFNSNNRIDIGVAQPFYNKSYMHFYPMFFFNIQKYFYPKKKLNPVTNN
jgi:hypothetical protein